MVEVIEKFKCGEGVNIGKIPNVPIKYPSEVTFLMIFFPKNCDFEEKGAGRGYFKPIPPNPQTHVSTYFKTIFNLNLKLLTLFRKSCQIRFTQVLNRFSFDVAVVVHNAGSLGPQGTPVRESCDQFIMQNYFATNLVI
jgi:hypothetical protein